MMVIKYSSLEKEAMEYWSWDQNNPPRPLSFLTAKEGAGSEVRTPLMHYGTVAPVYLTVIRYLRKILEDKPKKKLKLLELGCGTGRFLGFLAQLFPNIEVWGSDYAKASIKYAKENYAKWGVKFVWGKVQKTGLKAKMFDVVISSHVIEHILVSEGPVFLKEVKKLLKTDGWAFIGTPEVEMCQNIYQKNPKDEPKKRLIPPHLHEYGLDELKRLAIPIFGQDQVQVDKLINESFRKVFKASIVKFRPGKGLLSQAKNKVYILVRDKLPRPIFDWLVRLGTRLTFISTGVGYKEILMDNVVKTESSLVKSDNLLLVCRKNR